VRRVGLDVQAIYGLLRAIDVPEGY